MKNITNKQSKVYWENVILLAAFAAPKVFNFVFNKKKKKLRHHYFYTNELVEILKSKKVKSKPF